MSNHIPTTAEMPASAVEIAKAESSERKSAAKKSRKPTAKAKAKAPAKQTPRPKAARTDTVMPTAKAADDLVVFAFRLAPEERDLIHEAAGPARASRFVRAVALAAARGDVKALQAILLEVQGAAG